MTPWRVLVALALALAGVFVAVASIGAWLAVGIGEGLDGSDAPLDGYGLLLAGLAIAIAILIAAIRCARPLFARDET